MTFPRRGEIYLTNLEPIKGSEQGKIRPCLIVQNDVGNRFSPTTIVVPMTSKVHTKDYPHEIFVRSADSGLTKDGMLLLGQIRAIDKGRIIKKLSIASNDLMTQVDAGIKVTLGIFDEE